LLDKAKIPLGSNDIIIQHDAVRIVVAPSFNDQEGTQFTYGGTYRAIQIGDGTKSDLQRGGQWLQVLAVGAAVTSAASSGIFCVACRYSKMDQVSVRNFSADLGIAFTSASTAYASTNELSQPFLANNLFGVYTEGANATNATNQLRIVGGEVTCSSLPNSNGIYCDINSNLMQVVGVDIEGCLNGIVNAGYLNYISGSHTVNILHGGVHIHNLSQAGNLGEYGHTFAQGTGVPNASTAWFSDAGSGTRRCDQFICP
jgi:hypothetical protein